MNDNDAFAAELEKRYGFTLEQLDEAFNKVRTDGDWRAPIDAIIDEADRGAVDAAVIYFTATEATFTSAGDGRLRVIAAGYRMGPAGP
ncbi:MAG: hypothetical protein ACRD1P_07300 [Thermoanaerobaculia bacterium]